MVYCGRLSGGCANCRKRKIRCDLKEPSCLQCQRAGFTCPGRQNLTDLNFRDQSHDITQKVGQSISQHTKKVYPVASAKRPIQDRVQIDYALLTNPSDQSICIFLHNYAPGDSVATKVYLTNSQIVGQIKTCYTIRCAISAIGLAVIANTRGMPGLLKEAREQYATALRLTNVALKNERTSLEDTTLNAVLLLGMFEVMAGGAPKSVDNWQKHITGAATLLELWDSRQKLTSTGIQLFLQLRAAVLANCLRTQTHVPETIKRLSTVMSLYRSEQNVHAENLLNLAAEVTDLIAEVRAGGISNYIDILEWAQNLDNRLEAWSSSLSIRWKYTVHTYPESQHLVPDHPCNSYYHLYPDIWACNIWACYRTARIIVNLVIRDKIPLPPNTSPQWDSISNIAKKNIERLSMDILLSVPYLVSLRFSPPSLNEGDSRAGGCLGGYSILWPLYVAASVSAPNSEHRKWAVGRLEYIGHTMGVGQAFLMAKVVRSELPHECLSVYDYCRSYRPSI